MIFLLLYEAAVEFYVSRFGPMNRVFGFDMQLNRGMYLLCIISTVSTFAQLVVVELRIKLIAAAVAALLWLTYWGNIADVVPNRYALISVLGILSLAVGVLMTSRGGQTDLALE
jgi:predicted acyltransferase